MPIGVARHPDIDLSRSRELASFLEQTWAAVNLARGIGQQVDQRRVQAVASHEHCLGADERDILFRNVQGKIDRPGRQCQLGDEVESPMVRVGASQIHQPELWIVKRIRHGLILRAVHEYRRSDLT